MTIESSLTPIAEQVAKTEQQLAVAKARHQVANDKVVALQKRISELETERQAIVAARQARLESGEALPDDKTGARLALIAADQEGLRTLLTAAQKQVAELDPQPLVNKLSALKNQWTQAIAEAEYSALKQRAAEAESLLLKLVSEIHEHGQVLGKRHLSLNWQPSRPLQNLLLHGAVPRAA